ncbi:MAG: TonB-dependent receptor plug domain-containing protein [Flavihumibacter sp.]|nr:TonB-dependent receptor plug domain-containing protein [Flavihumibacter sp.]
MVSRNVFIKATGVLTLATGLFSESYSQNKQSDLDPVTITASVNPIQTSRTGRNVFVIKGDRFLELPVQSVDELLRFLPGVEMQMRGPAGSQGDIVLRGGSFQQVLFLVIFRWLQRKSTVLKF